MKLEPESANLQDYLQETDLIDYSHYLIRAITAQIFNEEQSETEKIQAAFLYVRDRISHSWDIQNRKVTRKASDVIQYDTGICYAKTTLLAALLRSEGIPTGFCYQRLMTFDTPEKGYCIHALNAVYIHSLQRWIRLDARGNKSGIEAEFSLEEEKLAFYPKIELDERDYPVIYTNPNPRTIATLEACSDAIEMCIYFLPDSL
ncbi:transglutaminase-like domain-containing protein [Bacillus massiliigorillae]|uniref:transglutaminase-like domain-containing protein n=1 Tax=Bacillus massiliigorillae TaxID=1243664 RepID=UPI0003A19A14|nr:transglutaminase family protein [Bacillus massiliigorillae]